MSWYTAWTCGVSRPALFASSCAFTLRASSSSCTSYPVAAGAPCPAPAFPAGGGGPPPNSPAVSAEPTGTSRQSWIRGTTAAACFGTFSVAASSCCWNERTRRDIATPLRARYEARSSSRPFAAIWSETRAS